MTRGRNRYLLGLVFLLIINSVFFCFKNKKINKVEELIKFHKEFKEKEKESLLIYKELIKSSNKIIYPTSKKDFTFKSLKKKVSIKPLFLKLTYVLYIDNLKHCRPCIDTFIETFKKQSLLHPNLNYVLICKNFNEKELDILINDKNLELPIYTITNDKSFFLKMMDETSFPFYFTINNSLDISNVFLPSKKRPELNTIYFNNINENY